MDPAPQQQAPRVCAKHGITRDPLGHCVICDRGEDEEEADPNGFRAAITGLSLLALAVAGVLTYRSWTAREPQPFVPVVHAPVLPEPPAEDLSYVREQARAAQQSRDVQERKIALEKEMRIVPVRMYTAKQCALCGTAREFLKGKGYEPTEIDVDADPARLAELRALNAEGSVPTIVVGDEVIVGFGQSVVLGALYRAANKKVR